ncbi:MAG: transglutaminase domain-containing protein [Desulfococcaceae bacterium]
MQRIAIDHLTEYRYSNPIQLQEHRLMLRPREGHDVRVASSELLLEPLAKVKWNRDAYDNSVAILQFEGKCERLSIRTKTVIEHYEESPLDFVVAEYALHFPFNYNPAERTGLVPFLLPIYTEDSPSIQSWTSQFWQPGQLMETFVLVDTMSRAIYDYFQYQMREAPGVQPPGETLAKKSGSCRDFATLLMEACRYLGMAARFVSGYLHCPATERGRGATHAWTEVYLPGTGWKGFDPTTAQVVGSDHIAVAVERHPEAAPPVAGSFIGNLSAPPVMEVDVQVRGVSDSEVENG